MKILDVSAAALIGAIAVVFLMMSADLGRTAAMFPRLLSVTIIVLVVIYIGVQVYTRFRIDPGRSPGKEDGRTEGHTGGFPGSGRWSVIIGLIGAYMGLIHLIGFGTASLLFGIVLPYFGGYRKIKVILPVALAMTLALVVIGRLFGIPLPAGRWLTLF